MSLQKPKFFVHIGTGKTGSSALQRFLDTNKEALQSRGWLYCGMALENCELPAAQWTQHIKGPNFLARPAAELRQSLAKALEHAVALCRERGLSGIIWSHEALFANSKKAALAFNRVSEKAEIVFVAYLRRQDRWALSAYKQWAIRHKTNRGPVQPFSEWFHRERCAYVQILERWQALAPQAKLAVRIYERCESVIDDFAGVVGLDLEGLEVPRERIYETPSDLGLLLYKIYNSQFEEQKLPKDLLGLLERSGVAKRSFTRVSLDLDLPTKAELEALLADYKEENERLGKFSTPGYEVGFDDDEVRAPKSETFDQSKLFAALLMMLVDADQRITALSREVKQIRRKARIDAEPE